MQNIDMRQFVQDVKILKEVFIEEGANKNLIDSCSGLIQDATEPLTLMVMGEFSTGKSTFINALLGETVAAVNMTPTTAVITKICYGKEEKVIVHYKNNHIEEIDIKYFKDLTSESGEKNKKLHESINYVERCIPIKSLKDMTIIDSPGLNALISSHTEATNDFMGKADVVFWILSANQPYSESAIEAMGKLESRLKPVAIMNKMDWIDPEEDDPEEFLEEARIKLKNKIRALFGISAKMAFDGIVSQNESMKEESHIACIHSFIEKEVLPNREEYKRNTILDDISDMIWELYPLQESISLRINRLKDEDYSLYMQEKEHIVRIHNQFLSAIDPFRQYIITNSSHTSTEKVFEASLYKSDFGVEKNQERALALLEEAASLDYDNIKCQIFLGLEFASKKDGDKAFYWAKKAVKSEKAKAFLLMGELYEQGIGIPKNLKKSKEFYQKAADKGEVRAMYKLAEILQDEGEEEDKWAIRYWLEQAANGGDSEAMHQWANLLYDEGDIENCLTWMKRSVKTGNIEAQYELGAYFLIKEPIKEEEGIKLVKSAAALGSASAQCLLGQAYESGMFHFSKDLKKAKYWYMRAIENNLDDARVNLATMLAEQEDYSQNIIAILDLLKTAADNKNKDAYFVLGLIYENQQDKYVQHDKSKALLYFERAAEEGHPEAMVEAACLYDTLTDIDNHENKSFLYLKHAAEKECINSYYLLGEKFFYGKGTKRNKTEAVRWYKKGVEKKDYRAYCRLADCYLRGDGIGRNNKKAFSLYKQAFEKDESSQYYSAFGMAECYFYGYGVSQNTDTALKYYKKAATLENGVATKFLADYFYDCNDFKEALEWAKKAANTGLGWGMLMIGAMYQRGEGVNENREEAYKWFSKAALQGDPVGMNQAGVTAPDFKVAAEWYQKAATNGNAWGMYNLGNLYKWGSGVKQSLRLAHEWFLKSANQGITSAMNELGEMEKGPVESVRWYQMSANAGDEQGMYHLASAYKDGNGVEKNIETAYIWFVKAAGKGNADAMNGAGTTAPDIKTSMEWFQKAADAGCTSGLCNLGDLYFSGYGVEKDEKRAVRLYSEAAKKGDAKAMNWLGLRAYEDHDVARALDWYQKSAENGDCWGMYNLAEFYKNGTGVEQDNEKAYYWFTEAAERNNVEAMNQAGITAPDPRTALEWFHKAAEQGYEWGMYNVGNMYETGSGVEQNRNLAYTWYTKAADKGNIRAMNKAGDTASDNEKRIYWYEKAGRSGSDTGYYNLASLYRGMKKYQEAKEYYLRTIEMKGDCQGAACFDLGVMYADGNLGFDETENLSLAKKYLEMAEAKGNKLAEDRLDSLEATIFLKSMKSKVLGSVKDFFK